ncbi:MAG: ferritin-like domain-containing protein [Sneathiellaceae bacterium]
MTTAEHYAIPTDGAGWTFDGKSDAHFTWEYDDGRAALLGLYDKGKKQQWDAAERLDWSHEVDWENPMALPDEQIPIYNTPIWQKMNGKERAELRRHLQGHTLSQFLHGEQGALIATSKIVMTVPDADSKFYAATQVMDEARHVEAFSRLLHEKVGVAYPITSGLSSLLEQGLSDSRWDMTYLTMQILIEGLALAAFQRNRDNSGDPLVKGVHAYVMQDEARHVAFGRLALRDYYPELSEAERTEREEFVVEACYHMRDRFSQREVFENLGMDQETLLEMFRGSEVMKQFRARLFTRIVPTVKDIGLWGPKVREAFADMGVLDYAAYDAEAMLEADSRLAEDFDAKAFVARETGQPATAAE